MAEPLRVTRSLLLDTANDGSYATQLRGYVRGPIIIDRGSDDMGNVRISGMTLTCANDTGAFTHNYVSAALYGKLKRGLRMKVTLTHNSIDYVVWTGRVLNYEWAGTTRETLSCTIRFEDNMAFLRDAEDVQFAASASRTTEDALEAVLTAAGFDTASDLVLDGATTDVLPLHYPGDGNGLVQALEAVEAELGGVFFCRGDGKFEFKTRAGMNPTNIYNASIASIGPGKTIKPKSLLPRLRFEEQRGRIEVQYDQFTTGTAGSIVVYNHLKNATYGGGFQVPAGGTVEFDIKYILPVHDITTVTATTDYLANAASDGSGANRTTDVTFTVTNHGDGAHVKVVETGGVNPAYVTFFQVRGDVLIYKYPKGAPTNDSLSLSPGQTIEFWADYFSVSVGITSPVSGTDYKANASADGTGTDRTSNLTVTVTDYGVRAKVVFHNNSTSNTIKVTKFQIRGAAVQIEKGRSATPRGRSTDPISKQAELDISGGVKVGRGAAIVFEHPIAGMPIVTSRKVTHKFRDASYPLPYWAYARMETDRLLTKAYTVVVEWTNDTTIAAMLGADLYDVVEIDDRPSSGYNLAWLTNEWEFCRIVGLKHEVPAVGLARTTLRLLPTYLWFNIVASYSEMDTFQRPDSATLIAGNLGTQWTDYGDYTIASNKAENTASGHELAHMGSVLPGASLQHNWDLFAHIRIPNATSNGGVAGGSDTSAAPADYVGALLSNFGATPGINLVTRTSSTNTVQVVKSSAQGFVIGTEHSVWLMCEQVRSSGNTHRYRVWVDGFCWIDWETSSPKPSGSGLSSASLYKINGTGQQWTFFGTRYR